jgi:hypothetical protein
MIKTIIHLFFIFYSVLAFGQDYVITDSLQQQYDFINWEANKIKHADSAISFQKLYQKLDDIYKNKDENLHMFHI